MTEVAPVIESMQLTLEAEHAAVYVYGVLGGRVSASSAPEAALRLREAYQAHRGRRDQLRARLADLSVDPSPPAAAYEVDARGRDTADLVAVAATVEERCAEVYAELVARSVGSTRAWAVEGLVDAAVRRLDFAPDAATPFPGLPEL